MCPPRRSLWPAVGARLPPTAVPSSPDVDECAAEPAPCEEQQYCENLNGSFVCQGERAARPARCSTPSPEMFAVCLQDPCMLCLLKTLKVATQVIDVS